MRQLLPSVGVAALAAALAFAGAAVAQEPPAELTVEEVVESLSEPADAAEPAAPEGECEKLGMRTSADGLCEPAKGTRGWRIPSATAPGPRTTASVANVTRTQPVRPVRQQATRQARKDLLITFHTGSAELTEQGRANARVFAAAAKTPQLQAVKFEISGHTDSVGGRDQNLTLSQRRADAVMAYLVSMGVDGARLQAKGYGFDRPLNANPAAAANRRVEAKRID